VLGKRVIEKRGEALMNKVGRVRDRLPVLQTSLRAGVIEDQTKLQTMGEAGQRVVHLFISKEGREKNGGEMEEKPQSPLDSFRTTSFTLGAAQDLTFKELWSATWCYSDQRERLQGLTERQKG